MSLYLGKIHYWLYNKIKWAEQMEDDIIKWTKSKDLPADQWMKDAIHKYGEPVGNKLLEDEIDTGNIHGWLHSRIEGAELRLAYIVTTIIEANPELKEGIIELFENQGERAAKKYTADIKTPEDAFTALNDFILEGMPCDRVNEVISSDANKYSWRTTACLHKAYWDNVEGDVSIFYTLRDTWVKAFVETLTPKFKYTKTEDAVHEIIKQ
ncbi:MAG TPA: hypothetical protein GX707_09445 [Epulopiscium sp.]|nr:hypothetical protein [Candidatus Epulonipiscium sp.]